MSAILLLMSISALCAAPGSLQRSAATEWSAFPFDGFVPENGIGVHDPTICEFNGKYFCFNTSRNTFGMMRSSTDLIHWKVEGPVMPNTPEWLRQAIPQHQSLWAPEAKRVGDGLRMYYCASAAFGKNNSWIGFADCPNFNPNRPTEGWVDRGLLIQSEAGRDNFNAIDPSILTDPSGREWMLFGSYWSGIYIVEVDPVSGFLKHPDHSDMRHVASNPRDRANGIEAAGAVYREGYYYLIVNYGLAAQGVRSTYHVVVGRSKEPTGPFLDSRGLAMTDGGHEDLLNSSSPMFGPGGGGAFRDSHGRWLISYHYYDARRAMRGHEWGVPTLQVRDLVWSPDGWPLPGLPITPETKDIAKHAHKSPVGSWLHQADFGNVDDLDIRADGSLAIDGHPRGNWSEDGQNLTLHWNTNGDAFTDKVLVCYGGNYYVGRNSSGLVIRGIRRSVAGR